MLSWVPWVPLFGCSTTLISRSSPADEHSECLQISPTLFCWWRSVAESGIEREHQRSPDIHDALRTHLQLFRFSFVNWANCSWQNGHLCNSFSERSTPQWTTRRSWNVPSRGREHLLALLSAEDQRMTPSIWTQSPQVAFLINTGHRSKRTSGATHRGNHR